MTKCSKTDILVVVVVAVVVWSDKVLAWLSVWSEVQIICIWFC